MRELVRELDEARDALALVLLVVFAVVAELEEAEAVSDSVPAPPLPFGPITSVDPTADVDVLSTRKLAAEDKDDLGGSLVAVAVKVVGVGVGVVDELVIVAAEVLAATVERELAASVATPRAVLDPKPDLLADVDAKESVRLRPPAALELDTSTPVLVSAVVEGTGSDALFAPKRRCVKSISTRRGGIEIKIKETHVDDATTPLVATGLVLADAEPVALLNSGTEGVEASATLEVAVAAEDKVADDVDLVAWVDSAPACSVVWVREDVNPDDVDEDAVADVDADELEDELGVIV